MKWWESEDARRIRNRPVIGVLIGAIVLVGYSVFYVAHAIIHSLGIVFGFPCP